MPLAHFAQDYRRTQPLSATRVAPDHARLPKGPESSTRKASASVLSRARVPRIPCALRVPKRRRRYVCGSCVCLHCALALKIELRGIGVDVEMRFQDSLAMSTDRWRIQSRDSASTMMLMSLSVSDDMDGGVDGGGAVFGNGGGRCGWGWS
ncbi:hypothetical protein B0H12DRAFT_680144 [Mycena haematopus]|nr:hypothetical protein B0H12DRAFT_680144 [Mycena haematopus]